MIPAFSMNEVVKQYQDFKLGPLNLTLEPGLVLGYIGPNGSGKSTTMHCMTGLVRPDSGQIDIFGQANDPNKPQWKQNIGYVGDVHVFYERWTGERNLQFFSQFYPDWSHQKASELARRFRLPLNKKVKDLSSGDRVKLSLIRALAYSPRLLLLDEPTAGLDPVVRTEVLETLFEILETGESAIFYSTHILTDISRLADELVFLNNGGIVLRAAKEDLLDQWRKITFRFPGEISSMPGTIQINREDQRHELITSLAPATLERLKQMGVSQIREFRLSIEEIAVYTMKSFPENEDDE